MEFHAYIDTMPDVLPFPDSKDNQSQVLMSFGTLNKLESFTEITSWLPFYIYILEIFFKMHGVNLSW